MMNVETSYITAGAANASCKDLTAQRSLQNKVAFREGCRTIADCTGIPQAPF